MKFNSGTYTGDGTSSHALTGFGLGGTPDVVIIKGNSQAAVVRATGLGGTSTFPTTGYSTTAGILSLDSDGCTVDSSATVNANGATYWWMAWKVDGTADLKVLNYTGNGAAGHGITGVGFQPDAVWIFPQNNAHNMTLGLSTFAAGNSCTWSGALGTGLLTSIDADGFTVANNAQINTNSEIYTAVCMKNGTDFKCLSYTGDGTTSHAITTNVSFQPFAMFSKSAAATAAAVRFAGETSLNATQVSAVGELTTIIRSFDATPGFTVGASSASNTNTTVYHAMIFKQDIPPSVVASQQQQLIALLASGAEVDALEFYQ